MPVTQFSVPEKSEAISGALPIGANSPQQPPYGLYAEKLSGTSFLAPRCENQQTWMYRILPSSAHRPFETKEPSTPQEKEFHHIPNQLRWDPFDLDDTVSWIHGLRLVAGAGDPTLKQGLGIFIYAAGKSMDPCSAFYSADGDFLIVPQHGVLDIQTELGPLLVRPNEICIIPRGIRYQVVLPHGAVRGYILELYQGHFQLPELGPIGSNCLANSRDFQAPRASFIEDHSGSSTHTIFSKFNGRLFTATQNHSPFDVVAWHGLYYPYKYDLGRFCAVGSISYDHPDPSIFTVLTAPSNHPGTSIADFVIFPPRWLVAENTFRPPWYHRNTMSEFMGLIHGSYDAKAAGQGGFQPAGASLHNVMSAHGPDSGTFGKASTA
ncbi:MAG: hypothetical protein Q9190_005178, partial [Brigantiaea leucoxantha]